jgi:N6-adenosine-specific RNA methylase IME4
MTSKRPALATLYAPLNDRSDPFRVAAVDPPWLFDDPLPGPKRGAVKHYRCLSLAELSAFPLPPLAADCALFLWRCAAMQQEALDLMAAWHFRLKGELVWLKRTRTGKRHFGMGRIVRGEHETCLIGTRGRPVTRSRSIRSTFEAVVGRHSEKPATFYALIEALFDGPYVELFARRRRAGWTSLGDQLPRTEERAADTNRPMAGGGRSGGSAGALRCPRCGEDRLVEQVGPQGVCAVCGFVWKPATGTDDDA